MVRPAWNDTVLIKRYLDIGTQSLLIPYVQDGAEAAQAVAAMRYPTRGVDGVFIGPADLAAALGHLGDQQHAEVQAAIEDAIKRIRACGKPAGILATDEASARRYIGWGTTFTAVGLDAMILARGAEALAAKFKS